MSLGEIVAIHIACIWICLIAIYVRLEVLSRRADVATERIDILSRRIDLISGIRTPEITESVAKEPETTKLSFWQIRPVLTIVLICIIALPFLLMLVAMTVL